MPTYSNKSLRRAILETLAYVPFSSFPVASIVNAIRPEFNDLTEVSLMGQIKYLEQKGYVESKKVVNFVTEREVTMITITARGVDLLEGNCSDIGIECAR